MLKQFSLLYRQVGIRRLTQLMQPDTVSTIEMPQSSVLHYCSEPDEDTEIDLSLPLFQGYTKKVNVRWVTEYAYEIQGMVRHKPYNLNVEIQKWYSDNRSRVTKSALDAPFTTDRSILEIVNYSHLYKIYKYADSPLAKYHLFKNHYSTIFANIAKMSKNNDSEHFYEIKIGDELLSKSLLDLYQDKVSSSMLTIFDTDYKLLLLEFWKWFNPSHRHESILNVFSKEDMAKVVFIFTNQENRSVYLSLAYLNSWIKGEDPLKESGAATQQDYDIMQKAFLKLMISLNSSLQVEKTATTDNTPNPIPIPPYDQNDWDEMEDRSIETSEFKTSDTKSVFKSIKQLSDTGVADESLDSKIKEMDEELEIQELKTKQELLKKDVVIASDGEVQEVLAKVLSYDEIKAKYLTTIDPVDKLRESVEVLGERKDVSAADYRNMLKRINDSQAVSNPYNPKVLIKDTEVFQEDILLDKEKIQLAVTGASTVVDPSMNNSSLNSYNSDYINKVMKKEIISMVKSVASAGVLVKSYEIDLEHSVMGSYEDHRIELQPLQGVTSTLRVRLPVVNEDGTFTANNNKYSMRAQRVDVPIRKIEPSVVALTSYYGKTFVGLSEKKAQSQTAWLVNKLYQLNQTQPELVKEVAPADVYYNYNKAPFIYNALSRNFRLLKIGAFTLNFSHQDRETLVEDKTFLDKALSQGKYVCGTNAKRPVALDSENRFHIWDKGIWLPQGSIYTLLGISENDGPLDYASLNVFSKPVPVAVVLAYRMGLQNLLVLLQSKYGLQYSFIEAKRAPQLEEGQYSIRFQDGFLVADKSTDKACDFILAGFKEFEKETKNYPIKDFYHKHVYLNLLKSRGLTTMYLNEIDNLMDMFVDPITKRILEEMKEPLTFEGLLVRSSELLTNYEHPDSQDLAYQRIRGYERFAGIMYSELIGSIRTYKSKTNKTRSKIDMSPYQVWGTIMKDPANKLVEDINPIQNVKHQEIVTYVGVGGRDKGTINKKSRAYHENDIGVISEATVDSSDVGINTYMSCNPQLASMYGVPALNESSKPTNLLSSAVMLAPGSTNDDAKRAGFVSIQQAHTITAAGYHAPIVRTGYEYVIGHRTTDIFCASAKQDGEVIAINDKGLIVKYADGTTKGVQLGTIYGKAEGSNYPHKVVAHPTISLGYKFKKGQTLAYNTGFFEPDLLYPTTVCMKNSMDVVVAYVETADVHEDSCAVDAELSKRLMTETTYVRLITLDFAQEIGEIAKPGTKVQPDTPLMIIQDEITTAGGYDEKAFATLRKLSSQSPKAKYTGIVEKVEVFYHGEKEDMSVSIKALADASDRELVSTCKATGRPIITGRVTDEYRSEGVPLALGRVEIKIYITSKIAAGVADKGVLCNQMKTTIGEVFPGPIYTESGQRVDLKFSYRSVAKRIVHSPMIIGALSSISRQLGKVVGSMV